MRRLTDLFKKANKPSEKDKEAITLPILDYIGYGKENAIQGDTLAKLNGQSVRWVRREVEQARLQGIVILNLQDGKGYFRPTDEESELVRRHYAQERSRANSIIANVGCERAWLLERGVEL